MLQKRKNKTVDVNRMKYNYLHTSMPRAAFKPKLSTSARAF
jgi:hypothetical protein